MPNDSTPISWDFPLTFEGLPSRRKSMPLNKILETL